MSDAPEKLNLFFRLTTFAGAVFVVTILSLVAATFGDPQAPPALFLNTHGTTLVAWEVGIILAVGLLAMAVDRRQMLRDVRLGECASHESRSPEQGADHAEPDGSERICGTGESP